MKVNLLKWLSILGEWGGEDLVEKKEFGWETNLETESNSYFSA